MSDTGTDVTLVNVSTTTPRTLVVQGGAYGEHVIESVDWNGKTVPVGKPNFTVTLNPGCRREADAEDEALRGRRDGEVSVLECRVGIVGRVGRVGVLALVLGAAAAATPLSRRRSGLANRSTLRLGARAEFDGECLLAVRGCSRPIRDAPIDVQCVRAGEAVVSVILRSCATVRHRQWSGSVIAGSTASWLMAMGSPIPAAVVHARAGHNATAGSPHQKASQR